MINPLETRRLGLEDLTASGRKIVKRPYLRPKITILPIQLDFSLMVTSTAVNMGGKDNVIQVEEWDDSEGAINKDFDF